MEVSVWETLMEKGTRHLSERKLACLLHDWMRSADGA